MKENKALTGAFERLVKIMDELREQCPWDRKQTIHSLRSMTIEETYELADAITMEDWKGIKEEIGDLLLHVLFYAKIGSEQDKFSLEEAINGIADKLASISARVMLCKFFPSLSAFSSIPVKRCINFLLVFSRAFSASICKNRA